jgi:single-strand DNA-binding protein
MNRVIITGNVAKDPDVRQTSSGLKTAQFDLAVQRRFRDKQTGKREADFIRVVAWRQTAEFIEKHASKGTKLAVEGAIQTRSWTDNDGQKHFATEVVADQVELLGSRPQGQQQRAPVDAQTGFVEVTEDAPLPF